MLFKILKPSVTSLLYFGGVVVFWKLACLALQRKCFPKNSNYQINYSLRPWLSLFSDQLNLIFILFLTKKQRIYQHKLNSYLFSSVILYILVFVFVFVWQIVLQLAFQGELHQAVIFHLIAHIMSDQINLIPPTLHKP